MTRVAAVHDLATIAGIEQESFGGGAWSRQLIREHLEGAHHSVLVHDEVAYAAISVLGDVADLDRIAVLPPARRQGIAGMLLQQLIIVAREAGAVRMLLEVRSDNDAAIALYRGLGFETISRRAGYYPDGIDALVMQCEIKETR